MKMKKSQFKEAVKAVVRECLMERAELANKSQEEGMGTSGNDNKKTIIDDIVTFVLRKAPAIAGNPDKVAKVVDLLFQKSYGKGRPADPGALKAAVEKQMSNGSSEPEAEPAEENNEPEEKSEPVEKESEDKEPKEDVDEAAYKKVSPHAYTDAKEDKAREIQTEPEVNETAYKTVAPHSYTDAKEDKARTIQTEPEVNETAYKVQKRSYTTSNDTQADPANLNDPEVPLAEASAACRHSRYTRRDDGKYKCTDCGKIRKSK